MLCTLLAKKEKRKNSLDFVLPRSLSALPHVRCLLYIFSILTLINSSVLHANAPVEQSSTVAPVHKVLLNLRLMLRFSKCSPKLPL